MATEDPYGERKSEHRKDVKVTHQPELLEKGDEAVQDAVNPVHCSETKGKVTELCASAETRAQTSSRPPLDQGLTHTNKALMVEFQAAG